MRKQDLIPTLYKPESFGEWFWIMLTAIGWLIDGLICVFSVGFIQSGYGIVFMKLSIKARFRRMKRE